ncbi:YhgE/Pip domain-containing protein [Mycobacterium sp. TY814]|uniref:YhgE/Pip domain-containing protein n=1 Tax=unclassified Mycobacterium TaxID=2642494 RepID=UPI002740C5EE|nr:YhgE/Pip domain-containing protein [Mycobacterium sp. TY814]MDP7722939.1 YhgE/Pip domain-containing protein [Mycobacterium sp. TY814]
MSQKHAKHAAPKPNRNTTQLRKVRFWLAPILITLALMSALAALYLGGILNPTTNLRHFPIAVVNQDAGPYGKQITDGVVAGLDKEKFDVRVVSAAEAKQLLDRAQVYGEMVIPPGFSSKLRDLGESAVTANRAERPTITISTNPRAGTLGSSIAGQTLNQAASVANSKVGERLSADVAAQTGGAPLAGASMLALTSPIDIKSTVYNPLPNGTGNGLSAFYYALLLLLAGFTGSIVVSTLVDSMLGYVPAEFGPVYRFAEQVNISRFRTLLVKWGLMVILALATSGVYMAIAYGLGMPITLGWQLWLFGVFAISAVGITSSSLIAVLGSMGLLFSMLVFVILGLPSAGATVPLEAVPPFFRWLAKFEPMHQVFLGVRSLVYLNGHGDAGLRHALIMTSIGLVIGLLLGGIITRLYDRKGFHRIPGAIEHAIAAEHQAHHQREKAREAEVTTEPGTEATTETESEPEPDAASEPVSVPEPQAASESASGQT